MTSREPTPVPSDVVERLCDLHKRMLNAIQAGRPYPVQQRIDNADADTILDAAIAIERFAALKDNQPIKDRETDREALLPCRACGSDCRVEKFEGPAIEGVMTVYFCSNSTKFGGDCPDPHAYLNVNAWNTRAFKRIAEGMR